MIRISKELETTTFKIEHQDMFFYVTMTKMGNIKTWSNIRCDNQRWKNMEAKNRVIIRHDIIAELKNFTK